MTLIFVLHSFYRQKPKCLKFCIVGLRDAAVRVTFGLFRIAKVIVGLFSGFLLPTVIVLHCWSILIFFKIISRLFGNN
jgi:hypothetical protein